MARAGNGRAVRTVRSCARGVHGYAYGVDNLVATSQLPNYLCAESNLEKKWQPPLASRQSIHTAGLESEAAAGVDDIADALFRCEMMR